VIDNLYKHIFFLSLFLYVLFTVFLFSHKKGNRRSNLIFAGFCLANAIFILVDIFTIYRHSLYKVFPAFLEILWESCFFLIGPLLFVYTLSMTRGKFTIKSLRPWHLLPFIVDFIFRVYRFFTTHTNHVELDFYDAATVSFNYTMADNKETLKVLGKAAGKGLGLIAMKTQCGSIWGVDGYRKPKDEPKNQTAMLK
jgi:hypothetical protein